MDTSKMITMEVLTEETASYTAQQNGLLLIRQVLILNGCGEPVRDAVLRISADPAFMAPCEVSVPFLPEDKPYRILAPLPSLSAEYLSSLTDRQEAVLHFSLEKGEALLSEADRPVTLLPYDFWQGTAARPDLLAAYVQPGHPVVQAVLARAASLLETWTGDPSLDGYQRNNPDRVMAQAAAVYGALQQENLVYAETAGAHYTDGQTVRLPGTILETRMGNCLDLTLLYAACLESMGLHPILILLPDHALCGFWLEDMSMPDPCSDDASWLSKKMAAGVEEIAVTECTGVCAGRAVSFDQAREAAEAACRAEDLSLTLLDIYRARLSHISPLPVRVLRDGVWCFERPEREPEEVTEGPGGETGRIELTEEDQVSASGRQTAWERRLLDLSLRNSLINLRPGRQILPLLVPDLEALEDALSRGERFEIHHRPEDWHIPTARISLDNIHDLGEFRPMLEKELIAGRLRCTASETDLTESVKHLYRTSRTMLEENGVGTLFLSLGMLRWYESDVSEKARYAPILLLPVEIIRRLGGKGYVLMLGEDEPQLNITVFEKIRQDFQIQISGLDTVPLSDPGVDVRKILTLVRHAIMDQKRWDVMETACLGIFSYSQFVMWNDLHARMDDLRKNRIVRSLIRGTADYACEDMSLPETVPEGDVYLPLPADATQLHAIRAAAAGVSFVLHGPPGTGKSQTITSMIANAIGNGRTVLFVAEKMAALSVVQRRLEKIGLGPFCLELHSNKATRRSVLDQLQETLEITRGTSPGDYAAAAGEAAALRETLSSYTQALHRPLACGLSVHELISLYESEEGAPLLEAPGKDLTGSDLPLKDQTALLERTARAFQRTGAGPDTPLRAVRARTYTQRMRFTAPERMRSAILALQDLKKAAEAFSGPAGLPAPLSHADLLALLQTAAALPDLMKSPKSWAGAEDPEAPVRDMEKRKALCGEADSVRDSLTADFEEGFLDRDGDALERDLEEAGAKSLFRFFRMRSFLKSLAPLCRGDVTEEKIRDGIRRLKQYKALLAGARQLEDAHAEALDFLGDRDPAGNLAAAVRVRDLVLHIRDLTGSRDTAGRLLASPEAKEAGEALTGAFAAYQKEEEEADRLLCLFDDRQAADWFSFREQMYLGVYENAGALREWTLFMDAFSECAEHGLQAAAKALFAGLRPDLLGPAFRRSISRQLIIEAVDDDPALSTFSGLLFNSLIERFSELDEQMQALSAREIFCRLSGGLPDISRDASGKTELGILKRAIKSRGRGTSIRRLFEMIPNLLPRLCPCMLMSPLSAAQFLDPARPPFDLVIFDEASQLQTCKAVGALARGKDAVIVGDPNQMPPTTFFMTQITQEDDPDMEDLESILDDALTLGIPETHLLWHYRSRHESLIAFSNARFYRSRLYTFPSAENRSSRVSLVPVEGVYERSDGRRNRREAEAVVTELVSRFEDPLRRDQSIGIVTFNIAQQHLIDDLFSDACLYTEGLEAWAYDRDEPLFIKNLETVQGDERDVILFSIGFGPDKAGRIHMNFGPLNREGGWRRLNVAVSRARQEMKVFSSLKAADIRAASGMSRGAEELRAFLAYAAGEPLPVDAAGVFPELEEDRKNGILMALSHTLKEAGYETDLLVGRSGFRVDLGVIDPERPGEYLLGVLLDGSSYRKAGTVRDREIAQKLVLEGLGWSLVRVWTMDWWDDRDRETERVLAALRKAEENRRKRKALEAQRPLGEVLTADPRKEEEVPGEEPSLPEDPARAPSIGGEVPVYRPADLPVQLLDPSLIPGRGFDQVLTAMGEAVIEAEAPINETLLIRRVLSACSIPRITPRLRKYMKMLFRSMQWDCRQEGEEIIYWKKDQDPESFREYRTAGDPAGRREIEEIPGPEIRACLCRTLFDLVGADSDSLVRETARALGFPRMGEKLKKIIGDNLVLCMEAGRISYDGSGTFTLSETETDALRA